MADFYDSQNTDVKTVYERCREYYSPEDFVVVMNIDTQPLRYIVQRPENVKINQPSAVTKELYYLKDPETITLQPGQTRLCPAYEADHMIKALIDKIVLGKREVLIKKAKSLGQDDEAIQQLAQSMEAVNDPSTQHKYIKQIFQGKRDFLSAYNDQIQTENTARKQATEDLEESDEPEATTPKPPGRPKKQVA